MKRVLVGVLVALLAFGLVGCKSISEKIGEEVGEEIAGGIVGGDVEVNGDAVTIETEDGEVTLDNTEGEMPEDFPDDFPMYDDVKVDSTSSIASAENVTHYINLTSEDEVKDVYEWYKSEFESEGWTIEGDYLMTTDGDDNGMLSVKKDGMTATVTVNPADSGGAEIGIILLIEG